VVASAEPRLAIGCAEQCLDLARVEVADDVALVTFGGDRHDPRDGVRVFGVFQCRVPVEGVDRAEPGVAAAGAVAAVVFEVGEERADQRRVKVVDIELERLFAGLLLGEAQQQPERVAVSGDGVWAGVALGGSVALGYGIAAR
jgi:hypothetical protein